MQAKRGGAAQVVQAELGGSAQVVQAERGGAKQVVQVFLQVGQRLAGFVLLEQDLLPGGVLVTIQGQWKLNQAMASQASSSNNRQQAMGQPHRRPQPQQQRRQLFQWSSKWT